MRAWLDRWGYAAVAVACAASIAFAALFTRGDLLREAALSAAADQAEPLHQAQTAPPWTRPAGRTLQAFRGVYRDDTGAWRMNPFTSFDAARGQAVRAARAGTVTSAWDTGAEIQHGEGFVSRYDGLASVYVTPGDTVETGQSVGAAGGGGAVLFCLSLDGAYVDIGDYLDE